jgi:hypothetical protein
MATELAVCAAPACSTGSAYPRTLNATADASGGDPAEAAAGRVRLALLPDDGPSASSLLGRDHSPVVGIRGR